MSDDEAQQGKELVLSSADVVTKYKSSVLGRVKDFLGVMAEANQKLELDACGASRQNYDIEMLSDNEQEYIEMDLLLGIADLQTPEAVDAAEAAVGGFQPSATSISSSSCSDSEDESEEDNDNDNNHAGKTDKQRNRPNMRPKIVVLN